MARVPQAFARVSPVLVLSSVLVMAAIASSGQVSGQGMEGTVRIVPPISSAPLEEGRFEVYVVLENLEHQGTIYYDDDRDTVPDRGVESVGMAAFELTLEFDQAVVAVEGVEPGPDLGRTGRSFQCLPAREEPGKFSFGCLSPGERPAGLQGSLTLATVTLRPLGRGSSPLLLQAGLAGPLGDDVPVQAFGAVVRATGSLPPAATGTPTPGITPGEEPVSASATPTPLALASETPSVTAAPATAQLTRTATAGLGGNPDDLNAGGNSEAENGGWQPGAGFWSAVGLGALTAVGALGLSVMLWRRRQGWGA